MKSLSVSLNQVQGRENFPLPLVPIEQFMLWDDTPDYPKRFRVILDLKGDLHRELLEKAVQVAAERHPLVLARIDSSTKPPCWVIPNEPQVPFRWLEGSWHDPPFADEWDLANESGVRIWVSQSAEQLFQVGFEVHHASIDGLGLRQFVADMIIAYDHGWSGSQTEPELKKLLPERLLQRGLFTRPKPSADSRPTTMWEKITQAYSFHFKGPVALAPPSSNPRVPKEPRRHIYRRFVLNQEQRAAWEQSLRQTTTGTNSTHPNNPAASSSETDQPMSSLNDFIVARFFQVLAEWNQKHARAPKQQRLRVMIPTDLRTFSDGRLPAANRLGFGFVISNVESCSDLPKLIDQVTRQTQAIRKFSLGLDFIEIFGALTTLPGLAKRIVRIPRCMATGVLTNLGDLSRRHRRALLDADESIRIGNTVLEFTTCFPPLRPKTFVGIGVCGTRDSLTIGLILDAKHGTVQNADALLAAMVKS